MTTGPPGFSRLPPALRRPAVLDACSLLNLCAADPLLDDLAGLGARFHIVPQVRQEVLFLRGDGPGAPARVRVDIETAVQRGTLTPIDLSSQTETDLFLSLVGDGLHDGGRAKGLGGHRGRRCRYPPGDCPADRASRILHHTAKPPLEALVGSGRGTCVGCLMRSGRFSARPTVARPAGDRLSAGNETQLIPCRTCISPKSGCG